VEPQKPTVLCDFEFHFTSGELLCVTVEEGRDTASVSAEQIALTVRPEPGTEIALLVDRAKLNAFQRTKRTLESQVTTEDAGRLQVIGA